MRYAYEPDVEAFRTEVRQFIAENLPPEEVRLQRGYEAGRLQDQPVAVRSHHGLPEEVSAKGWLAMARRRNTAAAAPATPARLQREGSAAGAPAGNMAARVSPSLFMLWRHRDEQKASSSPASPALTTGGARSIPNPAPVPTSPLLQTPRATAMTIIINGQKI